MEKSHQSPPLRRRWYPATVLFAAAALAACAVEQAVVPDTAPVTAKVSANKSALDAFVEAQGTWCDRNWPGDCDGIDNLDVGYYFLYCEDAFCASPLAIGTDFGGVNPRWWVRRGLPPLPAFSATGSVNESITRDGRRRLVINVRARNTFVTLVDLSDASFKLGADFMEFPGVDASTDDRQPELGEATISADITLPAGYVGMPDLYQIYYDPDVYFDITKLVITSNGTGTLRQEVRGIPAGTRVAVSGEFHELAGRKYSGDRQKFFRNARSVGLAGAARITVRPLP